jgi:ATP-dependent RNA helicase RhlE
MLDMGFAPQINRLVSAMPPYRQTLLFSATMPPEVEVLARKYLRRPHVVEVSRRMTAPTTVQHAVYPVPRNRKSALLVELLKQAAMDSVLVFTRMKVGADRVVRDLEHAGISATALHADKRQTQRDQALADFRSGKIRVLVATDIAQRGLDISGISHVINYDVPAQVEDYVHRIGRTGRAGQKGAAISLCCPDERAQFQAIKRLVKLDIPATTVSGYEPQSQRGGGATQRPAASHHAQSAHRRHHASAGGVAHAHTDPRRDPQDPFQRRRDAAPQARHAPQRPAKPRRHASKDRAVIV